MAHPEAGALWNWLTSATYSKAALNDSAITVAPDPANPPIVQAFHGGHWGGWTFEVNGSTATADGSLKLSFSKGGYQEARGSSKGAESFIENAKGLLDAPREWWLDASTSTLYFMANGTEAPVPTGWVASGLETVLHVKDVVFTGGWAQAGRSDNHTHCSDFPQNIYGVVVRRRLVPPPHWSCHP